MRRALLPLLATACTPPDEPYPRYEQPLSPPEVAPGPCSETEPHVVSISKVTPDGAATADDELPIWLGSSGGAAIDSPGFEVLAPAPYVALVFSMVDEETGAALEIYSPGEDVVDPIGKVLFVGVFWNSQDCSGTIEPFNIWWWPEDVETVCAIEGHPVRVDSWAFEIDSWPVTDIGPPQASATYVAKVDDLWHC